MKNVVFGALLLVIHVKQDNLLNVYKIMHLFYIAKVFFCLYDKKFKITPFLEIFSYKF
jgi:hypothetical protein